MRTPCCGPSRNALAVEVADGPSSHRAAVWTAILPRSDRPHTASFQIRHRPSEIVSKNSRRRSIPVEPRRHVNCPADPPKMNFVLAIEPDSSQTDQLSSVVRARLGAELVVVSSAYAAIVAVNQRVPDVVLFGRTVSQEQRVKITAHLRSLNGSSPVRTLDIPQLAAPVPAEKSGFQNPFRKKEAVAEV